MQGHCLVHQPSTAAVVPPRLHQEAQRLFLTSHQHAADADAAAAADARDWTWLGEPVLRCLAAVKVAWLQ